MNIPNIFRVKKNIDWNKDDILELTKSGDLYTIKVIKGNAEYATHISLKGIEFMLDGRWIIEDKYDKLVKRMLNA